MECETFKRFIQDYLDEELPEDVKGEWQQHFEACLACRTEVQIYQKCIGMLQRFMGEERPPETLRERLKQKLGCNCFDFCFPEQPEKEGDLK
jgi:anti-sigma factor RsiW